MKGEYNFVMTLTNIAHLILLTNIAHYTNLLFIVDMTQTFCSMMIDPGPINSIVLTEQVKHRFKLLWNPGGQVIA